MIHILSGCFFKLLWSLFLILSLLHHHLMMPSGSADHKMSKLIGPLFCINWIPYVVGASFSSNTNRLSYPSVISFIVFSKNVWFLPVYEVVFIGNIISYRQLRFKHRIFSSSPSDVFLHILSVSSLDLFKSLVVLWIVNIVNKLIHLHHIIHQNPQSILYEL